MKIKGSFESFSVDSLETLENEIKSLKKEIKLYPIKESLSIEDLNKLYTSQKMEMPHQNAVISTEIDNTTPEIVSGDVPVGATDPVVLSKLPGQDSYVVTTPKKIQLQLRPAKVVAPLVEEPYGEMEVSEAMKPFSGEVTTINGETYDITGAIPELSAEELAQVVADNTLSTDIMIAPNHIGTIKDLPIDSVKELKVSPKLTEDIDRSLDILDTLGDLNPPEPSPE